MAVAITALNRAFRSLDFSFVASSTALLLLLLTRTSRAAQKPALQGIWDRPLQGLQLLKALFEKDFRKLPPVKPKVRHLRFDEEVSCVAVRDLSEMPQSQKAQVWWQQSDFEEFLQVRVEIGKAYRAAAEQIGVDVMHVSSVGSHGDEGYRAMIQAVPRLSQESRRGLGLGRKQQRAKARDSYITAVLGEQKRQREEGLGPDVESISKVAMQVSQKDRHYAHFLAQRYFEQDRAAEANGEASSPHAAPAVLQPPVAVVAAGPRKGGFAGRRRQTEISCAPASLPMSREEAPVRSFCDDIITHLPPFRLKDGADTDAGITMGWEARLGGGGLRNSAKGFGLSRDKLKQVGLCATGHALSRSKIRNNRICGQWNSEDSDATTGESEGEWERPLFPASAKNEGTRELYRNWRRWAKAAARP